MSQISVIMSVYNSARYLAEAIESILKQSFTDFEFLIVDDGSTDESGAIIKKYAKQDKRIKPIYRENKGLIYSLNQLVDLAQSPYLARMDSDDVSQPERFARQIAFLEANPDYGVLGTWSQDIDEQGAPCNIATDGHPTSHEECVARIAKQTPICHPSVMMRTDIIRNVGGYHAAFKHCEDYDLWLRLIDHTKMCSLPERLLHYRRSEGQITENHPVEMHYGSAVSLMARSYRCKGMLDPTEELDALPPPLQLEEIFPEPQAAMQIRDRFYSHIVHSPAAVKSHIFDELIAHIGDGGSSKGHWRTVARASIHFGQFHRAARLALALLKS